MTDEKYGRWIDVVKEVEMAARHEAEGEIGDQGAEYMVALLGEAMTALNYTYFAAETASPGNGSGFIEYGKCLARGKPANELWNESMAIQKQIVDRVRALEDSLRETNRALEDSLRETGYDYDPLCNCRACNTMRKARGLLENGQDGQESGV